MLSFQCERCASKYKVPDDRAGLRTTCPKCGHRITVPGKPEPLAEPALPVVPAPVPRPVRRRTKLIIAVVVVIGACIIGVVAYRLAPNPTKEVVERRLRERLPPGYEELRIYDYDRKLGQMKFSVLYRSAFAPLGVRYEVSRFDAMEFSQGGAGQRVEVEGRKLMVDVPFERWLVVHATFDPSGKVVRTTGLTTAGPAEAAANEDRARQIALVVHGLF